MQILVCAAAGMEIQPITEHSNLVVDGDIDFLVTGIGLLASTFALTKKLGKKRYDLVIQAGLAGSFNSKLNILETVAIRTEKVADLGVMEGGSFSSLFHMGLLDPNQAPYEKKLLVNHSSILDRTGLKIADGITVNQITTDHSMYLHDDFN